jgi:hypothetical protein
MPSLIPLAAAFALALSGPAFAAEPDGFVTAHGVRVATPPLALLDCPGMRAVLDAIDASGYRGTAPKPTDPADKPLMDYENRVSRHFYLTCVHAEAERAPTARAFGQGYRP